MSTKRKALLEAGTLSWNIWELLSRIGIARNRLSFTKTDIWFKTIPKLWLNKIFNFYCTEQKKQESPLKGVIQSPVIFIVQNPAFNKYLPAIPRASTEWRKPKTMPIAENDQPLIHILGSADHGFKRNLIKAWKKFKDVLIFMYMSVSRMYISVPAAAEVRGGVLIPWN